MNRVYSFHGGTPLNVWERCSLQSFADHGHEIALFSYEQLDVPPGVKLGSATDIISTEDRDNFFALAPGRYAQFSDFFRYELLYRRGGWWVDTDVLCTSAVLPAESIIIGQTRPGKLANGVMRFPPGHPLLAAACAYCRTHQHLVDAHRTVFGPMLMMDLIKTYPVGVSEIELFYPIRGKDVWRFGEPESVSAVKQAVASSPVVHWFQEFFRAADLSRDLLPPAGSFLGDAFEAHGGAREHNISLADYRWHAPRRDKKGDRAWRNKKDRTPRKSGFLRSLWGWAQGNASATEKTRQSRSQRGD
jgi:Glycosyltransferase sugar-binding region containing DXD motif